MLKIAICDDDIIFLKQIKQKITNICIKNKIEIELYIFNSPVEVLKSFQNEVFDILFLDIDMPQITGFDLVTNLQKVNQNIYLIFVSNNEHLVFDSFEYHPFYFIRKSCLDLELEKQIITLTSLISNKKEKRIEMDTVHGIITIDLQKIYYIENKKNYVNVYMLEKNFTSRKNMNQLELELGAYRFIRVHSGYIVNIEHIKTFNNDSILLTNDKIIPVSRGRKTQVRQKIMEDLINYE